jgi:hypothetical protein
LTGSFFPAFGHSYQIAEFPIGPNGALVERNVPMETHDVPRAPSTPLSEPQRGTMTRLMNSYEQALEEKREKE